MRFAKKYRMKFYVLVISISQLFSAAAKPGEPYVLTGRESSVFGIFQADLKAYPELYEGEDVNEYYQAFKTLNNLGERKLQLGEALQFPDTAVSKQIREAEIAAAEKAAQKVEAAETMVSAYEVDAVPAEESSDGLSLFGSDRRSSPTVSSPVDEATRLKNARYEAVHYFQHTLLPNWIHDYNRNIVENIENGNIAELAAQAQLQVDEDFAETLVLHPYPDKKIYVLEFEAPQKVGDYFFAAVIKNEYDGFSFYSLEKGLSFFGAGDDSVLVEWEDAGDFSNLGGRKYKDLFSFVQELEAGPSVPADDK
jgi:hypothetical protein